MYRIGHPVSQKCATFSGGLRILSAIYRRGFLCDLKLCRRRCRIDSTPKIPYPDWQNEYQAALLELDREKLAYRINSAETAIFRRMQEIAENAGHDAERQAIQDALAGLRVLKRDSLGFPDWEKK